MSGLIAGRNLFGFCLFFVVVVVVVVLFSKSALNRNRRGRANIKAFLWSKFDVPFLILNLTAWQIWPHRATCGFVSVTSSGLMHIIRLVLGTEKAVSCQTSKPKQKPCVSERFQSTSVVSFSLITSVV